MTYKTSWKLLNQKKEVIRSITGVCFAEHVKTPFTERRWKAPLVKDVPHYFQYTFDNAKVTDSEMAKYFHFLRATPEFTHLMPRSIKKMVADKAYTADLTKVNGLQLFTILTLLRAVVELPLIVRTVARFKHKWHHALPHLGIIKAAGQSCDNSNHWITRLVAQTNLTKGINDDAGWTSQTPALNTGLTPGIHAAFEHYGDGYYADNPISEDWDIPLLVAQRQKPRLNIPIPEQLNLLATQQENPP